MSNKTSAKEWLIKAYHDASSAQILFNAKHFTDSIGYDIGQSIEKILKSFLAYQNKQITKTHDLIELSKLVEEYVTFNTDEIRMLVVATSYHTEQRYPASGRALPPMKEVETVLTFNFELLNLACKKLNIDFEELGSNA